LHLFARCQIEFIGTSDLHPLLAKDGTVPKETDDHGKHRAREHGEEIVFYHGKIEKEKKNNDLNLPQTENRKQKTENRKQKTENRKQKTENRKQKTENRKQKTENRKQISLPLKKIFYKKAQEYLLPLHFPQAQFAAPPGAGQRD